MVQLRSFRNTAALAAALLACTASLRADTITLKNGSKIEGKILSQTDKEIVIEEKISAGITDTRNVPKGDVVKVDKQSDDEPAYQALKNLQPGPNSLPSVSYDQVLKNLNGFVNNYSESSHVPDVKKQIAAWEAEKKRVDAGEVKLNNNWLAKEEAEKEKYQISGQVILNYMQQQARQGDQTGALNSFDQLEKNFPGARAYPDAVELAKQLLASVRSGAERTLQNLKVQTAEREKGMQLLSDAQKTEAMNAMQRDEQKAEAAMDAASKSGLKWPPLIANEKALTTIIQLAPEESKRLNEIPVSKLRQSIQLTEKARTAIAAKKGEEAQAQLKEALDLWSTNELATRLQADASALPVADKPADTAEQPAAENTNTTAAAEKSATSDESSDSSSTSGNEAAAGDDEPPFYKTPFGIAVIVVLLIVVIGVFGALRKISKRASEVIQ